MDERRKSVREDGFAVNITYVLGDGSKIKIGQIKNANDGGAYLETNESIPINSSIEVNIDNTTFKADVVWCQKFPATTAPSETAEANYGIGIKYKDAIHLQVKKILKQLGMVD